MNPKFPKNVHINPNINKQMNILSGLKNPNIPLSLKDKNSAWSKMIDKITKKIVIKTFWKRRKFWRPIYGIKTLELAK